jgi:hypothetical protein
MLAMRTHKYLCAARIFSPEPFKRGLDVFYAPALAEQHPPTLLQNADIKRLAAHRCQLASGRYTGDGGAHGVNIRARQRRGEKCS